MIAYLYSLVGVSIPLYVIRFTILGIPTNLLEIAGMITLLWSFGHYIQQKPKLSQVRESSQSIPMELYILVILACIGLIISQEMRASLGVLKAFFLFPMLFIMSIQVSAQPEKILKHFIRGIILGGALVSIIAFWQFLASGLNLAIRPTALYAYGLDPAVTQGGFANYLALYLTPILIISFWPSILPSPAAIIIRILLTLGIILTQSYGAFFSLILILGIHLFVNRSSQLQKLPKTLIGVALLALLIIGFFQFSTPKFQALFNMSQRNSITTRVQIWDAAITMIQANPIWGIGLADFQTQYDTIIPTKYFPPYEWLVPEPHNLYLAFWLHLGLGGIIWLMYMLCQIVVILIRKDIHQHQALYWLSLSLLSMYLYGLVDTPFWKNDLALLMISIIYGIKLFQIKPHAPNKFIS